MARILVADDSPSVRRLLVTLLADDGHDVVQVADGVAAFRLLTTEPFDVAALDVTMPGLDGLTLCRMLRDIPGLGHLAVVIVSADASEASALAAGADAFFSKPFRPSRLRAVVACLASGSEIDVHQARHGPDDLAWPSPDRAKTSPAAPAVILGEPDGIEERPRQGGFVEQEQGTGRPARTHTDGLTLRRPRTPAAHSRERQTQDASPSVADP